MIGYTRPLVVWWVQEVRGQFRDDWELPPAMVFPPSGGGLTAGTHSLPR
jgi:hypothetical protein